jgi:50S ribosomal subunit-associated GTPase HflX
VLEELGVGECPRIVALNKIDRLFSGGKLSSGNGNGVSEPLNIDEISAQVAADMELGPNFVPVSAQKKWGLDALLNRIQQVLAEGQEPVRVLIPYAASELVSLFHEKGSITSEEHTEGGTLIEGKLPGRLVWRFAQHKAK